MLTQHQDTSDSQYLSQQTQKPRQLDKMI